MTGWADAPPSDAERLVRAAQKVDLDRAHEINMDSCFRCHGAEGLSTDPDTPRLAGQHFDYIARQLADFQSGRRESDVMQRMAADLTEEEMLALGVYFNVKPSPPQRVRDSELAAVGRFLYHRGNEFSGVPNCAGCHGGRGMGTSDLPRLAGQSMRYTETQLQLFSERPRTEGNEVMHEVASKLTELEIRALAAYISSME
ncbi:c-type cytochrome [Thioalkalivibrio denitrificans]|uniref:c-type cytochrome n=1 Tax=Thioalkalivibrio denitrificans TaxID=108003 RepID=UPI001FEAE84E|nr:c-type cytochrome [Thioalkalivibrio denitrificans]